GERLQAIAASPGIASGPAHVQVAQRFEFQPRGESPAHERERLLRAKRAVDEEIVGLVERSTVKAIREIFVTHREMLDDPELAEQVQLRLNRGESAEAAWSRVVEDSAAQQEALHDTLLAERAADLRDLGRRVLARLCGVE
ncbi:phosphoenolpyruvate-utilizing N-terminal domain-containing protein, partial [Pseudomonas aeruginosa]